MSVVMECDYDKDPTPLYVAITQRDWEGVMYQAENYREEIRTVIFRKDPETQLLKWRLLPIHAAILNDAPKEVIEFLLTAYTYGAEAQDDEGNLPIHLAIKKHADPETINFLLATYPECIHVRNREGQTPHQQAVTSSSEHKGYYMRALRPGPTYNAVTASISDLCFGADFRHLSFLSMGVTNVLTIMAF